VHARDFLVLYCLIIRYTGSAAPHSSAGSVKFGAISRVSAMVEPNDISRYLLIRHAAKAAVPRWHRMQLALTKDHSLRHCHVRNPWEIIAKLALEAIGCTSTFYDIQCGRVR